MIRAVAASLALVLAVLTGGARAGEGRADARVAATVFASPLTLGLALSANEARVGQLVRARVAAGNLGAEPLANVTVTIRSDPAGIRVTGSATRVISAIGAGDSQTLTWQLCGARLGSYVLLARASYADPDGGLVTSESPASLLTITQGGGRSCPASA